MCTQLASKHKVAPSEKYIIYFRGESLVSAKNGSFISSHTVKQKQNGYLTVDILNNNDNNNDNDDDDNNN